MAFSPSRTYRLRSAYFLLAFLSPFVFGYTPPATPNLPLSFEFLGSNAEAESTEFYNSQCDSNNFSWYGTDWFCAVGDPTNQVCYVKMAYHSSDVNNCQTYVPPEQPEPELISDTFTSTGGNNQNLIRKLELMRIQDFNQNHIDRQYQNTDLALSRQNNSLLSSLARSLQYANDNRSIVDAINTMRGSIVNQLDNNHVADYNYNFQQDEKEKVMFEREMGFIGTKLNYMHDTLESIDNKSGSGSGSGSDYSAVLDYIANSVGNLSTLSTISNNTSSIDGINNILSGQILSLLSKIANSDSGGGGNAQLEMQKLEMMMQQYLQLEKINTSLDSIKSNSGDSFDDSAILEHFTEANNQLSDIILRMRDIENAIGEVGNGNGSDTDSISENGCVSFQCTSNTPACYIARKEWEKSCSAISENNSNDDNVNSLTNQLSDFVNHPDSDIKNLDAGTVDIKQFTNHYNSLNGVNFGGSDTCPPPYVIDAKITTFTLDLTPFCDLATVIKFFLIAFASVASGLMIVKYH